MLKNERGQAEVMLVLLILGVFVCVALAIGGAVVGDDNVVDDGVQQRLDERVDSAEEALDRLDREVERVLRDTPLGDALEIK